MSAARPTATRVGPGALLAWLGRLFRDRRSPDAGAPDAAAASDAAPSPDAAPAPAAMSAAARLEALRSAPTGSFRFDGPLLDRDGLAGFSRFIGFELTLVAPLPAAEAEALEALAAQVLAHASANPPDPDAAPSLASRILERASDPEVDVPQLTRLVSQDPAVAAEVLNVANSAAMRGREEAKNVRDAITRIGLREAAQIAAALAVRTLFDGELRASPASLRSRLASQFKEAMVVAMGSAALAMQLGRGRSDYAFLGGMFHDVGGPLALRALGALLQDGKVPAEPAEVVIDRLLDRVHLPIGLAAHQAWKLPSYLIDLCAHHHDTVVPPTPDNDNLLIVRVVSGLRRLRRGPAVPPSLPVEIEQSLKVLGVDAFRLRALDTQLNEFAERFGVS